MSWGLQDVVWVGCRGDGDDRLVVGGITCVDEVRCVMLTIVDEMYGPLGVGFLGGLASRCTIVIVGVYSLPVFLAWLQVPKRVSTSNVQT